MRTLQIHYKLKTPGGNYRVLEDYLKGFGAWAHVHESLWLVRANKSVGTVRSELKARMRPGDRVVVFDVTADSWATNFDDEVTEWMQKHMGTVPLAV
jgi:hypothetical protein